MCLINKKIIYISIFIATFFINKSFAHDSPDLIDISCGLSNHISTFPPSEGPKLQYVTYSISHKLLKQHFNLENGQKTIGGFFKTLVPVEVKIKTSYGTITKNGGIWVYYYESGAVRVDQFERNTGYLSSFGIWEEYPDDNSYKDSMKNQITSCKIFP